MWFGRSSAEAGILEAVHSGLGSLELTSAVKLLARTALNPQRCALIERTCVSVHLFFWTFRDIITQ